MHAIHNARIQLLATAFNNLGLAIVVAGLVAPIGNGQLHTAIQLLVMLVWMASGMAMHVLAQIVLGRLRQ